MSSYENQVARFRNKTGEYIGVITLNKKQSYNR